MTGITVEKAVHDISQELEAQYPNNIIGVRIINSLAHQYFINGGFSEVTKRTTLEHKNKVEMDLGFG